MKKVLSVSLGSSKRNSAIDVMIKGEKVHIERLGTDGDKDKAKELFEFYDGLVDAFGIGGTDLYLFAGTKPFAFKDSFKLIEKVKHTPVLDGSGIKNSFEPYIIEKLVEDKVFSFKGKKVLHVCGVDRFAMGKALVAQGADVTFGDLIYGLGLNIPIKKLDTLQLLANLVVPFITKLPINWFYPTGDKQEEKTVRHPEYFRESDYIVGDFHFIKKFMPTSLPGKTIITNTVTKEDRAMLKAAGIECLVTVTPNFEGRSFGTNVLEATLVALSEKNKALTIEEYKELIKQYDINFEVTRFETKEFN